MLIQDAIYGLMDVSDICVSFMNTREFQRLKRIKQLGNVPEVYPSGTHTRAEHCLGVMHISGVFYDSLMKNSDIKWRAFEQFKPLIQLAGLLHDIGHGPKSHLFEEAMKIRNIAFCHEEYSVYLINRINSRLSILSKGDVDLIKSMIFGKKIEGYPAFLFEIVANKDSGLDTDKMDYLVRDAYHIGKSTISVDYIIKHNKIDKYGHVCYSDKAMTDIRTLFANRKLMYEQVYFHKTVVRIDKMWICAMCQLQIDFDNPDCFLELDDSVLDYLVRNVLKHDVIRCLDDRDLTHQCDECPGITLRRVAKLSGDTDDDPLLYIRFYES
jgi:HD superfamily phosphohydrolase